MNKDELRDGIMEFFEERNKHPKPGDDLFETGTMDSMDLIELVAFLDDELSVVVDQEDLVMDNFRTVERIVEVAYAAQ